MDEKALTKNVILVPVKRDLDLLTAFLLGFIAGVVLLGVLFWQFPNTSYTLEAIPSPSLKIPGQSTLVVSDGLHTKTPIPTGTSATSTPVWVKVWEPTLTPSNTPTMTWTPIADCKEGTPGTICKVWQPRPTNTPVSYTPIPTYPGPDLATPGNVYIYPR